jgi:aryl-alcohol dehydrogenase-like predicted oxidoreductase
MLKSSPSKLAADGSDWDSAWARKELLTCLADIARAHDAGISQVALNWLLARDSHVIPIPGATKPHHARANLDALGWRLSETEFEAIDRASARSLG